MSGAGAGTTQLPHGVFVRRLDLGGDGPTVGVKDSIDIAGQPTQLGSAAFAGAPPATRHAAVVEAVLAGGCRIIGKTNLHELAYGVTGINTWTGTPHNPAMPDRVPGGSSSGSAVAVAARLVDFAIGTDTGGSIRIPAACCGVLGLKPTFGRVSRSGVHPAASSLDCVGPFASGVGGLERAMRLIDPTFRPRAAPPHAKLARVEVAARDCIAAAVRGAMAHPNLEVQTITLPLMAAAYDAALTIISAENWSAYGHLADSDALGDDVRARLRASRAVSGAQVAAAEAVRRAFQAQVDAALSGVDALVLPTMPDFPPLLDAGRDAKASLSLTTFVRPFNLSGHPALTLPIQTADGLPCGLQFVGRRGEDETLCAVAHTWLMSTSLAPGQASARTHGGFPAAHAEPTAARRTVSPART
jgi:amidase